MRATATVDVGMECEEAEEGKEAGTKDGEKALLLLVLLLLLLLPLCRLFDIAAAYFCQKMSKMRRNNRWIRADWARGRRRGGQRGDRGKEEGGLRSREWSSNFTLMV